MNSLDSLIENLYQNNVVFSYYGFIDDSVLTRVLEITESRMAANKESSTTISHVRDAIMECVEHSTMHNLYPDDTRTHYKSLLAVSRTDDAYKIDCVNVINDFQKGAINDQLDYLRTRELADLHLVKARDGNYSDPMIKNPGLVDIVLRNGACGCSFKNIGDSHLFNVNYTIALN